jgi:hypothetical protein
MFSLLLALQAAVTPAHAEHQHTPVLGRVRFESSCNGTARLELERGLQWLHSFEYEDAERSFAAAAAADKTCGIAHWGRAMSLYHPLWAPPSAAELDRGRAALRDARAAGLKTARERDYVTALEAFYQPSTDHKSRVLAWLEASGRLYRAYPSDREAGIFHALALIAAGTLDADQGYAREKQAAKILNAALADNPDHPGVAHYLIHSFDYPALAKFALPAARRYAGIAPASAHAQHMPSHIFVRLGYWDEAIRSNLAAEAAARDYARRERLADSWDERLHAMDYLAYGYLQAGDTAKARSVLDALNAIAKVDPPNFKVAYAASAIPARYALERRAWAEAASLELSPSVRGLVDWSKFRWAEAHTHLARAVGAARTGDAAAARAETARLEAIEQALTAPPGEYDWRKQVEIQRRTASAWTLFAEGRSDEAVTAMQEAAAIDDATEKHPVTPGSVLPAREQLGELLLALNRRAEARTAFETALKDSPGRATALRGLREASTSDLRAARDR